MFFEKLESRFCLAVQPVDPSQAVAFQKFTLDPNQGGQALEKALADIDGDGRLDAIIGQGDSAGGIDWYSMPASGVVTNNWSRYSIVGSGRAYEDMMIRDVNNDGAVDVIASIANTLKWFQNPRGHGGNPRTDSWASHSIGNVTAHDMVISDFDLDGKFDIATNTAIYFQNSPDSWTTVSGSNYARTGFGVSLLDIGEGTRPGFGLSAADPGSPPPLQPPPPSGGLDLVGTGPTGSPYANYWYENPIHTGGNPRTQQWVRHYVGPTYDSNYSVGGYTFDQMDVNEDGRMDIVTAQSEQPNDFAAPPPEGLAWWEAPANRRTGTWIRHQIDVGLTQMHKTRVADINLDGREDLVVAEQEQSANDRVAVLFKQPDFSWRIQVLSTGSGHNVTTADIDGDGDFDILNAAHSVYGAAPNIELYVNGQRSQSANAAPQIRTHPISRRVNPGQSVTFVVAATGAAPLSFQWLKNGVEIPGATNAYYTLINATAADNNAQIRAAVINPIDVVLSKSATVYMPPTTTSEYLSDMNPTFQSNGWGPYERDRSNGDAGAGDGQTITLNSATYAKGLGVHAGSELRYALNGLYQNFLADVGVDDEVGSTGSIVFQVWADGTKLFDSGAMTGTSATKSVNVSVSGKNELRLIVTDSGNGNSSDHGDWANARLAAAAMAPGIAPAARSTVRFAPERIWDALTEPDELPLL